MCWCVDECVGVLDVLTCADVLIYVVCCWWCIDVSMIVACAGVLCVDDSTWLCWCVADGYVLMIVVTYWWLYMCWVLIIIMLIRWYVDVLKGRYWNYGEREGRGKPPGKRTGKSQTPQLDLSSSARRTLYQLADAPNHTDPDQHSITDISFHTRTHTFHFPLSWRWVMLNYGTPNHLTMLFIQITSFPITSQWFSNPLNKTSTHNHKKSWTYQRNISTNTISRATHNYQHVKHINASSIPEKLFFSECGNLFSAIKTGLIVTSTHLIWSSTWQHINNNTSTHNSETQQCAFVPLPFLSPRMVSVSLFDEYVFEE
jgi:hypothetical protein